MGIIYYLIPDLLQRKFKVNDFLKSILKGQGLSYLKNNVFRQSRPVGGIKVMYQHCMMLQELGYEAYPLIMGKYVGNFFGYDITLKHIKDVGYELSSKDVVVSPEFLPYLGLEFDNCLKVLFNQSQSWLYLESRLKKNDKDKNYLELGYDYVLSCSEFLSRLLEKEQNISSCPITNGIDINKFFQKPELRLKGRVLALSRKNPEHINNIIQASKGLGFEFRVVDGLTEEELIYEYQQADVFLATGYPEGFGLPQLEAMLCGCVVIGFSGGGGDEYMINNLTALVSPDGDCADVVSNLKVLENDEDLKEMIRENGYEKASLYTLENMKRMLKDFYVKLM
ncbi:glycosyltransferase family 4 protein [uncultured Cycloclasticus sp.]|uniref:glycosyltransferase family 4 protein n=1 Tax=uncultured Cycloclasticus sp. TaxID=172194 RepID=UPI00258431F7|nr:glycosyltransferase family 4 protein [uncultured Cycloclasticus sp.]